MDVILIPGLWLEASSWDAILPALERAGHIAHPLTMPGTGEPAAESSSIGIADWVSAVVAEVDRLDGPVAIVGHSAGGNVAWGAVDARPDRIARVVFVDTAPPPNGSGISKFNVVDGVIPFPGWDYFDSDDVADLNETVRAQWAERARSVPEQVPVEELELHNDLRYGVPVTILSSWMDEDAYRAGMAHGGRFGEEFEAIADVEVVKLNSGHWPQFSKPLELARAIVNALR
ncbi:alpha/beta hydrolase [Arthrobacter livingstonensis]|uniref:Alpha/beta hydrolase n=1 Tax=Arthrobacter livingstonensis TaxID=670078 RepID=A0A2V5L311_9MICC|nr:alpha/beta hydrolase [Arthrobacter livingstonensis]PYI65488.1 alpha/beta hydrolase [Arthrobacter livingstonensis]